jgi:predicted nuclease of predicted toxin-antitoxin system
LRDRLLKRVGHVIWIRRGNCSTDQVNALLRQRRDSIEAFERDSEAAFLVLG